MHVHHHEKPVPIPRGWTLNTEKSAVPPKVCADDTYTRIPSYKDSGSKC